MVNKKLDFKVVKTTINIRKIYWDQIKGMDGTARDFIDRSISKELEVINKSDEWIYQQINTKQREIESLETLLTENAKQRNEQALLDIKFKNDYDRFCNYLKNPSGNYNTKRVNEEYGVNLVDYNHFQKLQQQNNNGGFSIDNFKQLKVGV